MSEDTTKTPITLGNDTRYLEVAEQLIKLNAHGDGRQTCREVDCDNIACKHCPLTPMSGLGCDGRLTYSSLAEVRRVVDRIHRVKAATTEEPKATESIINATSDVRQPKGSILNDPSRARAAERILSRNGNGAGYLTCSDVKCYGVDCASCPLTHPNTDLKDPKGTYSTLGELRGAMDRVKKAEKAPTGTSTTTNDVHQPSHYKLFQDVESIEVIARSMTVEQFHGFCFGNILKYRLRAGKKSELATMQKDLAKASFYETLFEQHKDKCHA